MGLPKLAPDRRPWQWFMHCWRRCHDWLPVCLPEDVWCATLSVSLGTPQPASVKTQSGNVILRAFKLTWLFLSKIGWQVLVGVGTRWKLPTGQQHWAAGGGEGHHHFRSVVHTQSAVCLTEKPLIIGVFSPVPAFCLFSSDCFFDDGSQLWLYVNPLVDLTKVFLLNCLLCTS